MNIFKGRLITAFIIWVLMVLFSVACLVGIIAFSILALTDRSLLYASLSLNALLIWILVLPLIARMYYK